MLISPERLYIATIDEDAPELAKAYGTGLELDEFCTAVNMDEPNDLPWRKIVEEKMLSAQRFVFHAPFAELSPAAVDPLIGQVSRHRYEQIYAIVSGYGVKRMVVHSGFVPHHHYEVYYIGQSIKFWNDYLQDKPGDFQVLLENVLDWNPRLLAEVAAGVNDSRLRICWDIGHSFVHAKLPWQDWLEAYAPYLAHVHIHDNDGVGDQHKPLGEGSLPLREIIDAIEAVSHPTYTIENMQAANSLRWLCQEDGGKA
ncbi:MAG: sugar phosphate isomerase/epimerase [Firmicutes bacterium]|nr:sugar phosphate isomerase/epimerase [Bacillota bacterium]